MNKLAVLGASGHGKVIADIALLSGWQQIEFFDDRWPSLSQLEHWQVVGNSNSLAANFNEYDAVIVAIGHNQTRLLKQQQLQALGANLTTLIHPKATISPFSQLGAGSVVMANAVVNPFVVIGDACIINTAATVDHDCVISDGVHLSPGVHLAGGVTVGETSWLGIGSTVIQLVEIGSNVTVGANSTVIHSISCSQKVVGSPAKPL